MKISKSSALFICLSFVLFSCKKEINEKETLTSIKKTVIEKTISKETFKTELLPRVQELYQKDSIKYRILNHIAKKATNEKNTKIFNLQVNDIRQELKFIQ